MRFADIAPVQYFFLRAGRDPLIHHFFERDSCIGQQISGSSAITRQMPSRANLPVATPLRLNATKRGQQHRNLNPETRCEEPTDAGNAMLPAVQRMWSDIVRVESLSLHKSPCKSISAASITQICCSTLTSPSGIFRRHGVAVGVKKAQPLQFCEPLDGGSLQLPAGSLEVRFNRAHNAVQSDSRFGRFDRYPQPCSDFVKAVADALCDIEHYS